MKYIVDKEIKYGIRNYKFLILAIIFVLFAVMTPLMMKYILPELLFKDIMGLTEIEQMLDLTQKGVFSTFLNDFLEIGTLVVCIMLASLIPTEYQHRTVLFLRLYDIKTSNQVIVKWFLYSLYIFLIGTISIMLCYIYTGLLFEFDISLNHVLRLSVWYGIFMFFIISLLIVIGAYVKKRVPTMMITYVIVMFSFGLGQLLNIHQFLPTGLMNVMTKMDQIVWMDYLVPVISSFAIIFLSLYLAIHKLNHMDLESLGDTYA